MTEYIVLDRTLGTNFAITVYNSRVRVAGTAAAASSEPIVQDRDTASNYWKIFVDNGRLGFETTATAQDDNMVFTDVLTGLLLRIEIFNGRMRLSDAEPSRITDNILVRYENDGFVLIRKTVSGAIATIPSSDLSVGRLAT